MLQRSIIQWILALLIISNFTPITHAEHPSTIHQSHSYFTEEEFRNLAHRMAVKVNAFHSVWEKDPEAEFYAGTARDFLYWLFRQLKDSKSKEDFISNKNQLLKKEVIDIREIIGMESDLDIMSRKPEKLMDLTPATFGIRKLDIVNFDRIDPSTRIGRTEIDQGFISIEKIRISMAKGILESAYLGNGAKDLFEGRLHIEFPDPKKFWTTHYAEQGSNHPILLTLRYLRLVAQDYYNRWGKNYPDLTLLLKPIPPTVQDKIYEIIRSLKDDPHFQLFLKNQQGLKWLNASILKSFRSYTNPTATHSLYQHFGMKEVIEGYSDLIIPINQFLFLEHRNTQLIEKNRLELGFSKQIHLINPTHLFQDQKIYHGAGSEQAFRAMIFQGIIPSESGSAGRGWYGVSKSDIEFAKQWSSSKSGREDLIISANIDSHANIVDIRNGPGQDLWNRWIRQNAKKGPDLETQFCRELGIDILIYPYNVLAVVVKNSAVLREIQGVSIKLKSISEILDEAEKITPDGIYPFMDLVHLNNLSVLEIGRTIRKIPEKTWREWNPLQRFPLNQKPSEGQKNRQWNEIHRIGFWLQASLLQNHSLATDKLSSFLKQLMRDYWIKAQNQNPYLFPRYCPINGSIKPCIQQAEFDIDQNTLHYLLQDKDFFYDYFKTVFEDIIGPLNLNHSFSFQLEPFFAYQDRLKPFFPNEKIEKMVPQWIERFGIIKALISGIYLKSSIPVHPSRHKIHAGDLSILYSYLVRKAKQIKLNEPPLSCPHLMSLLDQCFSSDSAPSIDTAALIYLGDRETFRFRSMKFLLKSLIEKKFSTETFLGFASWYTTIYDSGRFTIEMSEFLSEIHSFLKIFSKLLEIDDFDRLDSRVLHALISFSQKLKGPGYTNEHQYINDILKQFVVGRVSKYDLTDSSFREFLFKLFSFGNLEISSQVFAEFVDTLIRNRFTKEASTIDIDLAIKYLIPAFLTREGDRITLSGLWNSSTVNSLISSSDIPSQTSPWTQIIERLPVDLVSKTYRGRTPNDLERRQYLNQLSQNFQIIIKDLARAYQQSQILGPNKADRHECAQLMLAFDFGD